MGNLLTKDQLDGIKSRWYDFRDVAPMWGPRAWAVRDVGLLLAHVETLAAPAPVASEPAAVDLQAAAERSEVEDLEAWWTQDDIAHSCENAAADIASGNTAAIDEAVELLRVMAHRERKWKAERDALAAALAFYGNRDNHEETLDVFDRWMSAVRDDNGEQARQALAAVGKTAKGGE